jgi:hypothetical protein
MDDVCGLVDLLISGDEMLRRIDSNFQSPPFSSFPAATSTFDLFSSQNEGYFGLRAPAKTGMKDRGIRD